MIHLVQIARGSERRVALVREPDLLLLDNTESIYGLAAVSLTRQMQLSTLIDSLVSEQRIRYDDVYSGNSDWKLLAPIDHPADLQKVLVSGTGLTHVGSARERDAMHTGPRSESEMTDSMRMFEWGRQSGRPREAEIGVAPEWFYKGDGSVIRAPFAELDIPGFAEDGGEEAEIAAIYMIGKDGIPYRVGFATGNEFSDHVFEKKNYLNLAGSKLRSCSLGPELVIGAEFRDVHGSVRILRDGSPLWQKRIQTGEKNMSHSLANLEHHHFKFPGHRQPGMLHVHFLGADALSFGENVRLQAGDVTEVSFEGFGRPLRNRVITEDPMHSPVQVQVLS